MIVTGRIANPPEQGRDSFLVTQHSLLFETMKLARRAARELALNIIYQADSCGVPFEEALDTAMEFADLTDLEDINPDLAAEARDYARTLATGVRMHLVELDAIIARLSEGWTLDRQPAVDRNVLRMALYEILHVADVPPIVAVDEAVEMAKKYSTAESGRFVNGVLAGFFREYKKETEAKDIGG